MKLSARAFLPVVAAMAACSRGVSPSHGPIVVLRFENLTGDPALDWMERGAARAIAGQIEGAAAADSAQPSEEREHAIAAGSARVLHGYLSRVNSVLRLQADLEDAVSSKFVRVAEASGPAASGVAPLADSVAREIDPGAGRAPTRSETALEAYTAAFDAPNPAAAAGPLAKAIEADPNFGAAYLGLIEIDQARQDHAAAQQALAAARARGDALSPADRARLDVAAAQMSDDSAALSKALAALARLTPDDAGLLRGLAASELKRKSYASAIGYLEKALAAQPGDTGLLNTLGYARAYAGDLEGATKALREYERIRPDDANALDSLGDVHFYLGRFAEAEQFYRQEFEKNPAFFSGGSLLKAAKAHLFTGDAAGAEKVFAEYENARREAGDPLIGFTRAGWDYLRGKRSGARKQMEAIAVTAKSRDLASLAHSTLAIWLLEAGDRGRAQKHAEQASASAAAPAASAMAAACRAIAQGPGGSFPNQMSRAYALLLEKDFGAALPLLREIDARTAPSPSEVTPTLVAWALEETGRIAGAAPYLRTTPVPSASAAPPFESLVYPRIFRLRAIEAEKRGDRPAAAENTRIFESMGGVTPLDIPAT